MDKSNAGLIDPTMLKSMFVMQDQLNIKYGGEDWRNNIKLGKAKFAVLDEVSEFLREIETTWKWWKVGGNYHHQKALYELIDVVHFAMLITLHKYQIDDVIITIDELIEDGYPPSPSYTGSYTGDHPDKEDMFCSAITHFLDVCNHSDIDEDMTSICDIVQQGGKLLNLSNSQDIFNAYVMKNQRNHQRVDGGVLTGHYDKSKESDIPE